MKTLRRMYRRIVGIFSRKQKQEVEVKEPAVTAKMMTELFGWDEATYLNRIAEGRAVVGAEGVPIHGGVRKELGLFGTGVYPPLFEEGSLKSILRRHRLGKRVFFQDLPEKEYRDSPNKMEERIKQIGNINWDPNADQISKFAPMYGDGAKSEIPVIEIPIEFREDENPDVYNTGVCNAAEKILDHFLGKPSKAVIVSESPVVATEG